MGKTRSSCHDSYREGMQKILRRYKRAYKETSQQAADGIGVSKKTYDSWIDGTNTPSGDNIQSLFSYYGADFVNDYIGLGGYTGAYEVGATGISVENLHALLASLNNQITIARTDNHVDHKEDAEIKAEIPELINNLVAYVSK